MIETNRKLHSEKIIPILRLPRSILPRTDSLDGMW